MFEPNDNGYPTMIHSKSFGVPAYKIVYSAKEHEDLLKSMEPETPKMGRPKKNLKFDIEE